MSSEYSGSDNFIYLNGKEKRMAEAALTGVINSVIVEVMDQHNPLTAATFITVNRRIHHKLPVWPPALQTSVFYSMSLISMISLKTC